MSMEQGPASPGARSRTFSFRSDKSSGSKNSGQKSVKPDLTEDPREKQRRDSIWKNSSKANPNAALDEAQPGERAAGERATIESLRSTQHRDSTGHVIAEPDLSNPTRPRWERPLDTIRSFERSIDDGYRRRSVRADSYNDQNNPHASKRNSSFAGGEYNAQRNFRGPAANGPAGYDQNQSGRYSQQGGYYGNRSPGYENGFNGGPPNPRARYGQRMQSDSGMRYGNGSGYPQHGYHGSHDTVNTGASDSTGPWGNSTDPSSENSSLDRVNGVTKPQDNYSAPNGYGPPIMEEGGSGSYGAYNPQQMGYGRPPNGAPAVQPPNVARRPIPLNNGAPPMGPPPSNNLPTASRAAPEKRQSWFKRRFSSKN